jgi:hypothetical protein
MTTLKDKIENGFSESRILILGIQIIIGFQFNSVFQNSFSKLPVSSQYLKIGGLALMLAAFVFLIAPSTYYLIVEKGENTLRLNKYINTMAWFALLPFAVGMAIDMFVSTNKIISHAAGIGAGIGVLVLALTFWYAIEFLKKSRKGRDPDKEEPTALKDKIKETLTGAKMIIPGAQALLGFQFTIILMEGFEKLSRTMQYTHLGALALVVISVILLMTPAAYHRLVENGENTESFFRRASNIILISTIPLALGICIDYFVVVHKVTHSLPISLVTSVLLLILFYALWFGYTIYRRSAKT